MSGLALRQVSPCRSGARARLVSLLLGVLIGAAVGPLARAADAPPAEASVERERIRHERALAQQRYAEAVNACHDRFVMTACLDEARAERRVELERLLREQEVVDQADRRRRARDRLRRIEDKMSDADRRSPPPSPTRPVARTGTGPAAAATPRSGRASDGRVAGEGRDPRDERDVAVRRADHAQRLQQAQAHRLQVEQRNAERQPARRVSEPLPVPPAATLMPASAATR